MAGCHQHVCVFCGIAHYWGGGVCGTSSPCDDVIGGFPPPCAVVCDSGRSFCRHVAASSVSGGFSSPGVRGGIVRVYVSGTTTPSMLCSLSPLRDITPLPGLFVLCAGGWWCSHGGCAGAPCWSHSGIGCQFIYRVNMFRSVVQNKEGAEPVSARHLSSSSSSSQETPTHVIVYRGVQTNWGEHLLLILLPLPIHICCLFPLLFILLSLPIHMV